MVRNSVLDGIRAVLPESCSGVVVMRQLDLFNSEIAPPERVRIYLRAMLALLREGRK